MCSRPLKSIDSPTSAAAPPTSGSTLLSCTRHIEADHRRMARDEAVTCSFAKTPFMCLPYTCRICRAERSASSAAAIERASSVATKPLMLPAMVAHITAMANAERAAATSIRCRPRWRDRPLKPTRESHRLTKASACIETFMNSTRSNDGSVMCAPTGWSRTVTSKPTTLAMSTAPYPLLVSCMRPPLGTMTHQRSRPCGAGMG